MATISNEVIYSTLPSSLVKQVTVRFPTNLPKCCSVPLLLPIPCSQNDTDLQLCLFLCLELTCPGCDPGATQFAPAPVSLSSGCSNAPLLCTLSLRVCVHPGAYSTDFYSNRRSGFYFHTVAADGIADDTVFSRW